MTNVGLIVLGIGLFVIFAVFIRRFHTSKTRTRNLDAFQALNSPSVRNAANPMERRIAVATREAAKGFTVCPGCSFENTQRSLSCLLCGAALPVTVSGLSRLLSGQSHSEGPTAPTESTRQRRVKKRKEWTRTIGAGDAPIWVHDKQLVDPALTPFPAYVLEKSTTRTKLAPSDHIAVDVETDPALVSQALGSTAKGVGSEIDLSIVRAVPGYPASSAFSLPHTTLSMVDSVNHSLLDFPSKLAEFISATTALFHGAAQEREGVGLPAASRFHIVRETLLSDSLQAIARMSTQETRVAVRVEFAGEKGVDAGAVYRSWLLALNQAIVTPEAGIFTCVNNEDKSFYLNPHSREVLGDDHLDYFHAAGRLIGRALMEGNATGFHLALPLLKIILGLPVGFSDLEYFDPESFKNLKWLVDNDGVAELGLDFTVTVKLPSGETRTVDLMPGGSDINVCDANKLEFIDRKLKYLLFESVSSQLQALLKGVYEVVPVELLMVFDAEELDYVLSGSYDIDVDDWEAHTVATIDMKGAPYDRPKPLTALNCYDNFWKVVRELSVDERRRLLQFCTGSTRAPPGGFSSLTSYDGRLCLFTLIGIPVESTQGNLRSHACFNRLDLPTFWGLKSMREAVHAAIASEVEIFTMD